MEGNVQKMRDALEKLRTEIGRFYANDWIPYDAWQGCDEMIGNALSAPPRNCDVGTAEEQAKRFSEICIKNSTCNARGLCSEDCPFFGNDYGSDCALKWAQMPYESEAAQCQYAKEWIDDMFNQCEIIK